MRLGEDVSPLTVFYCYFGEFWLRAFLTTRIISSLIFRSTQKPPNNSSIRESRRETKKLYSENKKQQKQAVAGKL